MVGFSKLIYLLPPVIVFLLGYIANLTGFFGSDKGENLYRFIQKFSVPVICFLLFSQIKLADFSVLFHFSWMFALVLLIPLILVKLFAGYSGCSANESSLLAGLSAVGDLPVMGFILLFCLPDAGLLMPSLGVAIAIQMIIILFVVFPSMASKENIFVDKNFWISLFCPVMIASMLGFVWMIMQSPLAGFIHKPLISIAKTLPAVMLLFVGLLTTKQLFLRLSGMQWFVVLTKCVFVPLIAFVLSMFFQLEQGQRFALIILSACPSASYLVTIKSPSDDNSNVTDIIVSTFVISMLVMMILLFFIPFGAVT